MNTNITLEHLSITYLVDRFRTSTFKEWVIGHFTGSIRKHRRHHEVHALRDLSFTIGHGERVGVIGLNGAGKSTLLKVMSGLLRPTAGKLTVEGTTHPLIELGAGFNPEFTGRENIYFNGAMLGYSKKQIKTFEEEIIEFSELQEAIDLPTKTYSSGMNARLAFSIAGIIQPEILLLDEMLAAGDASFQDKAKRKMASLVDDAKILVLVSHNTELVRSLCPRTIVLQKGAVVFDGNSAEAVVEYQNLVRNKNPEGG